MARSVIVILGVGLSGLIMAPILIAYKRWIKAEKLPKDPVYKSATQR